MSNTASVIAKATARDLRPRIASSPAGAVDRPSRCPPRVFVPGRPSRVGSVRSPRDRRSGRPPRAASRRLSTSRRLYRPRIRVKDAPSASESHSRAPVASPSLDCAPRMLNRPRGARNVLRASSALGRGGISPGARSGRSLGASPPREGRSTRRNSRERARADRARRGPLTSAFNGTGAKKRSSRSVP